MIDFRCVLGRNGRAVPMSFDHKPTDPPEESRIRKVRLQEVACSPWLVSSSGVGRLFNCNGCDDGRLVGL